MGKCEGQEGSQVEDADESGFFVVDGAERPENKR